MKKPFFMSYYALQMGASKQELRLRFKELRAALSPNEVKMLSKDILDRLRKHPALSAAGCVFSYIAFGREVDTRPLLAELVAAGKLVVAPGKDRRLDSSRCFHFLGPHDPILTAEKPEIETPDTCDLLDLRDVDIFLVPGIVWDEAGYRIGFGGGYFDKILSKRRPDSLAIGLAYEFQVLPALHPDPWDQPVDYLVTEKRQFDTTSHRQAVKQDDDVIRL
ncbi:MAG: 5-formyltetrahydrofolate cyclo-ligase [Candidatus Sumerlaeaceae bacterium]|nr:5-formyltetrahydrofolate cyclo-ligase [Candidatus Sumerlaeaceae bacterium]